VGYDSVKITITAAIQVVAPQGSSRALVEEYSQPTRR